MSLSAVVLLCYLGASPVLAVSAATVGWTLQPPADQPPADAPRLAGTEVEAPKRTKFVPPDYPPEAQARGLRGIVILELVIDVRGKVSSVDVVRSLPPFDEAAIRAARQWEYEVTQVGGKPVSVRLTVPITFAVKLPEVKRDPRIPELRQGVSPAFPASSSGREGGSARVRVTVDPEGQVTEAEEESASSPWSQALMQAIRTWQFTALSTTDGLSFRVEADFVPAGRGGPRVDLRMSEAKAVRVPARASAQATPPTSSRPAPSPSAPALVEPSPASSAPAPVSSAPAPTASAPAPPASAPTPPIPVPTAPSAPPESPAPSAAESPAPKARVSPTPGGPPPVPPGAPPVEVVPAQTPPVQPGPTAAPPRTEPGISAVKDVTLGTGVPDLTKGRRPVVPPLARLDGVAGTVEVRFVVESSGASSVRQVAGPEPLKEAARQTVASWTFRRNSLERLPLVATITYKTDVASATVKTAEPLIP
jgi:TonB family protein